MKFGKAWLKKVREPSRIEDPRIVVCEIPSGSRCKYELDKRTGHLELGRIMSTDCVYPTNYGFIPNTLSSDGMELDVLIITSEPLLPLTTVEVHIIGGFTLMEQRKPKEHKLLAVATKDPSVRAITDLDAIDRKQIDRIEHFFTTYKLVEDIKVDFIGWGKRIDALAWLAKARDQAR
ncbi:MAG: inorganic diphosphatase [Kofleriaceae bacterium]